MKPPKHLVEGVQAEYDRYREAGRSQGLAKAKLVSLCYSSQLNLPQQVTEYMDETCGGAPERRYVLYGEDTLLTPCPLFQPIRMTFVCYDTRVPTVMPPRPSR